jgi:predicted alpha/beta-fold hydrolase
MHFLAAIERPTLIINAADDPFMTADVLPGEQSLSPSVEFELSQHGGHVGFIGGGSPFRPQFYLPGRITSFLAPHLAMPGL